MHRFPRPTAASLRDHAWILLVGIAVLLPGLGDVGLWDVDESLWAGTAAEMGRRGDWTVPHFNGEVSIQKPPFMYWTMLVGWRLFGDTEFAARIGSATFGLATALVTYRLGRRLFDRRVGLFAGVALATALMFDIVSRGATPDSELVFFCTLALHCFVRSVAPAGWPPGPITALPVGGAVAMYAAMGLAVLTKGPVGVVLPTAAIGLFVLLHGGLARADGRRDWPGAAAHVVRRALAAAWALRPVTAAATVCLVAGPWYWLVQHRTSGAFGAGFIGVHNVQRFFEPFEHHAGSILYYLPALLLGFFPWSMFAIPTALETARQFRGGAARSAAALLLCTWTATWIGFFTLAQTKLPNYILPVFPATAVLTAAFLVRWLLAPDARSRAWMTAATALLACCGAAGAAACTIVPTLGRAGTTLLESYGLAAVANPLVATAAWIGVAMLVGGAACLGLVLADRRRAALVAFSTTAVAVTWSLFLVAAVAAGREQTSPQLVEVIRAHAAGDAWRLAQHGYSSPGLVFYSGRSVERCPDREALARFLDRHPDGFAVVAVRPGVAWEAIVPDGAAVIHEQPSFPKAGRVAVIRRAAPAGPRTALEPTRRVRP